MTFDDITENGRLWAVRYEDDNENAFSDYLINGATWPG